MKQKILLIGILPPPINGQSLAFEILVKGLLKLSLDFSIVPIPNPYQNVFRRLIDHFIFFAQSLLKVLKNDIVYLQVTQSKLGFFRDFPIIFAGIFFNKKIILHIHGGYYSFLINSLNPFLSKKIWETINKCHKIIVLSESIKKFYPNLSNIVVVENGIGNKQDYCKKQKNDDIHLLFLSNMIKEKGYLDVLNSIALLKKDNRLKKNVIGHFAGKFEKNSEKEAFFKLIEDNKINSNIIYHGLVTGDEKKKILTMAHFCILPTYYINEGQPLSLIEAMSYGCILLSTDYRGINSLIKNGYNGFFIKERSSDDIAEKIINVLNSEKLDELSRKNVEYFNQRFTENVHLNNLIKILCAE